MELILIWIGVGAVTGLLASLLLGNMPAGTIGAIVTGVVGAVVAGMLFGALRLPFYPGPLTQTGVAFVGSVLLLGIVRRP